MLFFDYAKFRKIINKKVNSEKMKLIMYLQFRVHISENK